MQCSWDMWHFVMTLIFCIKVRPLSPGMRQINCWHCSRQGYGCEIAVGHLQEWAESWTTFILSRPVCSSSLPGDPQVNRH